MNIHDLVTTYVKSETRKEFKLLQNRIRELEERVERLEGKKQKRSP